MFCAGVARDRDGRLVTAGGRVLDVVGRGATLAARPGPGLRRGRHVSWPGMQLPHRHRRRRQRNSELKVAVLMGSPNDRDKMQPAADTLSRFGIEADVRVLSAHRMPRRSPSSRRRPGSRLRGCDLRRRHGRAPRRRGRGATRRCRWSACRLSGGALNGVDALYATVQMPRGIPVATVAIDGAMNAALLVVQMLAITDESLAKALDDHREEMRQP